jgi:HipA-like C-terminal domain
MQPSETIRNRLYSGVRTARELADFAGVSQPTVSRALDSIGNDIVRFGGHRSIQYALRRGQNIPVYRISALGQTRKLGSLIPVHPEGYVMAQEDGVLLHFDGIPFWLFDTIPSGYLGRAYAQRHSSILGIPPSPNEWTDNHRMAALMAQGGDLPGNILIGDVALDHFLNAGAIDQVSESDYPGLAIAAANGEIPGSSAGGEQPKFTAFNGRHCIVKFTVGNTEIARRWQDLLRCEHIAMETLRESGLQTSHTRIVDIGEQRFLEIERFDRVGERGRIAAISLEAFDLEFLGIGNGNWADVTTKLNQVITNGKAVITRQSHETAHLLYAFGVLIGNTDMHLGNLSFVSEHGMPYELAPCYDMLPMCFAPNRSGLLPDKMPEPTVSGSVSGETWRRALKMAEDYIGKLDWFCGFESMTRNLYLAKSKISRIA